jgi:hypothetical protein
VHAFQRIILPKWFVTALRGLGESAARKGTAVVLGAGAGVAFLAVVSTLYVLRLPIYLLWRPLAWLTSWSPHFLEAYNLGARAVAFVIAVRLVLEIYNAAKIE